MKITLVDPDNSKHECALPYAHATYVTAKDWKCECGSDGVQSPEKRIAGHDEYVGAARCVDCKAPAGTLRVKVSTIFGIEEDERVLNGRCRVYG